MRIANNDSKGTSPLSLVGHTWSPSPSSRLPRSYSRQARVCWRIPTDHQASSRRAILAMARPRAMPTLFSSDKSDKTKPGGDLTVTDAENTQLSDDKRFLKHTAKGTFAGAKKESAEWSFSWKAPDIADVRFHRSGNSANNDNDKTGDRIIARFQNVTRMAPVGVLRTTWGRIEAGFRR